MRQSDPKPGVCFPLERDVHMVMRMRALQEGVTLGQYLGRVITERVYAEMKNSGREAFLDHARAEYEAKTSFINSVFDEIDDPSVTLVDLQG